MLDFVDGLLVGEAVMEVDAHLASCPRCRRLVSELFRGSTTTPPRNSECSTLDEAPTAPRPTLSAGDRVGRYIVESRVGAGAMGVVYAAHDPELDRKVALKLINAQESDGSDLDERKLRLQREAQAMARLSHPCVVAVHDVGEFHHSIFLAMEFIDGVTLREWLFEAVRPWPAILDALLRAGQGLQAAHRSGLVHRDFKLDNVLVGRDGRVCVTDFGLARPLRGEDPQSADASAQSPLPLELTRTGAFIGTPVYMAPELLRGEPADALSDQFSFCVALYEALYRERPFAASDLETHTQAKQHGQVRPPPRGTRVPRFVRQALLRGLSPLRDQRHPSMTALLQALGRTPRLTPRRVIFAVCGALILGTIGLGAYLHTPRQLCGGAEKHLTGVWDDARRSAVSQALHATGMPLAAESFPRIAPLLDAYRMDWIAMHTEACQATRVVGTQSDEMLSLRMDCLDRRREELLALTNLLEHADSKLVVNALNAVHALTPIAVCGDRAALTSRVRLPENRALRAKVEKIRTALSTCQALDQAGKFTEGLQVATRGVENARQLPYRPLWAEALYLRGLLESHSGHTPLAEKVLYEAVSAAEASRHDEIAARAWIELLAAVRIMKPGESQFSEALATAAVDRIGGTGALHAQLLDRIGELRATQGRYGEAVESYRAALVQLETSSSDDPLSPEIREHLAVAFGSLGNKVEKQRLLRQVLAQKEKALGPTHPLLGETLEALADVAADQEEYPEAEALYRRALSLREKGLEPNDPRIAESLADLGILLNERFRSAEALPLLEQALKINEQAYGTEHLHVAQVLDDIGVALLDLEDFEQARGYFTRALAIQEKLLGPDNPHIAKILDHLTGIYLRLKDFSTALAMSQRSLRIGEKTLGKDNPELAFTLMDLADAYRGLARFDDARATLERTCKLREQGPPVRLAVCRYRLAAILKTAGSEPARQKVLLRQAHEVLLSDPQNYRDVLADIERRLAQ